MLVHLKIALVFVLLIIGNCFAALQAFAAEEEFTFDADVNAVEDEPEATDLPSFAPQSAAVVQAAGSLPLFFSPSGATPDPGDEVEAAAQFAPLSFRVGSCTFEAEIGPIMVSLHERTDAQHTRRIRRDVAAGTTLQNKGPVLVSFSVEVQALPVGGAAQAACAEDLATAKRLGHLSLAKAQVKAVNQDGEVVRARAITKVGSPVLIVSYDDELKFRSRSGFSLTLKSPVYELALASPSRWTLAVDPRIALKP